MTSFVDTLAPVAAILAPATALAGGGAIVCLSKYAVPAIRSTASESSTKLSLAQLRSIFHSGAGVFPPMAYVASSSFALLAYVDASKRAGFILAALGSIGIFPFTVLVMLPAVNGRLLELDDKAKKDGDAGRRALETPGTSREVIALLDKFANYNYVRGGIMLFGGLVGLYTALQKP